MGMYSYRVRELFCTWNLGLIWIQEQKSAPHKDSKTAFDFFKFMKI